MKAWESIQKAIDWIEENLSEKIEMEQLSGIACLSPFYFQRLFNRLVGKPVMEYVKLRRIAYAADDLATNKGRIIDAAYNYGFENHETFSRTFKTYYGMTPESFRSNPRPLSHFIKPDISMNYCLVDENVPLVAEGIVLEVHRKVLNQPRYYTGLKLQNPISDTPGIDFLGELWDKFHTMKTSIGNLITESCEVGVSSPGEIPGHFTYFAGAEVACIDENKDFNTWSLPTGEYTICCFEAENFYLLTTNALDKARDYMFGTWLPNHKLVSEPFMAELYYKTDPTASYMEIWLKTSSTAS
jgi:AraC family transcriptional regulator